MASGKSSVKRRVADGPRADSNGNVRTTILMPETVHSLGVTLAKAQRRSFSSLLTTLIEKAEKAEVGA